MGDVLLESRGQQIVPFSSQLRLSSVLTCGLLMRHLEVKFNVRRLNFLELILQRAISGEEEGEVKIEYAAYP